MRGGTRAKVGNRKGSPAYRTATSFRHRQRNLVRRTLPRSKTAAR